MNFNHASNTRVLSFFTPPHTSFFCDFNVFISNAIHPTLMSARCTGVCELKLHKNLLRTKITRCPCLVADDDASTSEEEEQ